MNHLWQSTLFAIAAWALTIVLRRHSARTRYWIWFAASLKFLIPLSMVVALGFKLKPAGGVAIELLPQPLVSATLKVIDPVPVTINSALETWITTMWALGVTVVLVRWLLSWLQARSLMRSAMPLWMNYDIEVRVSAELSEPSVFGIREPVLLIPSAVVSSLSAEELDAVIAHELCHVRNRDNLTATVHMIAGAVFWFYPPVWWIGQQMLKEREHACDEAVIECGTAPRLYAEGILKACRLSLESRMGVMAAAGGSNLKRRVEAIVNWRPTRKLNPLGKVGLVAMGAASLMMPLLSGFAMPLKGGALSHSHSGSFESVSIELTAAESQASPQLIFSSTHLSMKNTSLRELISAACGLHQRQVVGGPVWLDERYDIEADTASMINRRMVLELLADKFGLRFIEKNLGSSDEEPL